MARRKRQNIYLTIAQTYLAQHMPDMAGAHLCVRMLDGPPGGPRYSVTAELCAPRCPRGIAPALAALGQCAVVGCPLRRSVRLLLDRRGTVLYTTRSGLHWG